MKHLLKDAGLWREAASIVRNTGESCIGANRVLVQAGVYAALAERIVERVAQLRVGNGLDQGVNLGPLIDAGAVAKVEEHVADALAQGARLLHGGRRHALGGQLSSPAWWASKLRADVQRRGALWRHQAARPGPGRLAPGHRRVPGGEIPLLGGA